MPEYAQFDPEMGVWYWHGVDGVFRIQTQFDQSPQGIEIRGAIHGEHGEAGYALVLAFLTELERVGITFTIPSVREVYDQTVMSMAAEQGL